MSDNRDFHESYFEHSCAVVAERDVLETEFNGASFSVRVQRWWAGLFLLSYSDERARVFYTSSYAMRKERQRHYRKFRGRIHPLSMFRNFWDFFMLIIFLLNKVAFHHNTSFIFGELCPAFYYIGAILELIIIADIFVNLATGYKDEKNRKVVLEKRSGIIHYCSTKLFFHTLSAMPLQWMIFVRYGSNFTCALCKTTKFVFVLELLSLFDLFRLYECSSYWSRERRSYKVSYFLKFLRIAVLGLTTMFQFIELADIITLRIMIEQGKIEKTSYVALLLTFKYGIENTYPAYKFFIFDFARICKSLLLFSFAHRKMVYHVDRMISLFAYMIANIFYLWTILECYALVCMLRFPEDRVIMNRDSMINMAKSRQLSDKVTAKLCEYYEFNLAQLKSVERHNHFFKSLPAILRREQFHASYSRFIVRNPYFVEWPIYIKENIIQMLKEEIYLKNDLVAEPWVQSEGLCIVAAGELAVYSESEEIGHLIDGDHFGELSLVTDREVRTSSVVALTPCLILILSKASFRRYMRLYPDLFFDMKRQLKDKFGASNTSQASKRTVRQHDSRTPK